METTQVIAKTNGEVPILSTMPQTDNDAHLIVEIDQETYDAVSAIATDAGARGMQDGFDFWLCRLAKQHAKVQENLWLRADNGSMFTRAQRGNAQAKRAVLKSLGLDDRAIENFLAQQKK